MSGLLQTFIKSFLSFIIYLQALSVRAKLSEKKSGSVFLTAGHVGNAEIANVSVVEKAASFDEQEICQLVKDCYFLQLASNIPVPLVASSDTVLR